METEGINIQEQIIKDVNAHKKRLKNLLDEISTIKSYELKMVCLFSIIDSYAQEYSKYNGIGNKETFCNFVLNHQTKWPFLNKINPVTLFYDVESRLKNHSYINCFLTETIYDVDYAVEQQISEKILDELKVNNVSEKEINKFKNKHLFGNLLYQVRNKISHEMSNKSYMPLSDSPIHSIPYYIKVSNYTSNYHRVEFIIPVSFMFDLVEECCNTYLNNCYKNKELPFANNTNSRKSKLCWYDY